MDNQNLLDQGLKEYISKSTEILNGFFKGIDTKPILTAAEAITSSKSNGGRVHVTGIGKPSHISSYAASLLSSTGTPSYFLDATEAVHGSAGQVVPGDVVIVISNSGQTEEIRPTVNTLKSNGATVIGITGGSESWLAKNSDIFLFAGVPEEGDTLNKPPRASILAETVVLQVLSVALQYSVNLNYDEYLMWHPGGALGKSIREMNTSEN